MEVLIENNRPIAEIDFCEDNGILLRNMPGAIEAHVPCRVTGFDGAERTDEEFMTLFDEGDFDVTILDLRMDGLDWINVYKTVRQRDPAHPIIFYSAHLNEYQKEMEVAGVLEDALACLVSKERDFVEALLPAVRGAIGVALAHKLALPEWMAGKLLASALLGVVPTSVGRLQEEIASLLAQSVEDNVEVERMQRSLRYLLASTEFVQHAERQGRETARALLLLQDVATAPRATQEQVRRCVRIADTIARSTDTVDDVKWLESTRRKLGLDRVPSVARAREILVENYRAEDAEFDDAE
jgi:CheY-like chemotaxis protein